MCKNSNISSIQNNLPHSTSEVCYSSICMAQLISCKFGSVVSSEFIQPL